MTQHAQPKTSTPTSHSSTPPNHSLNLAPQEISPQESVKSQHFLVRSPTRPLGGGPPHLMDPLLGACASKKNSNLRVIIVTPPTLNGLVSLAKVTMAEGPFNSLGTCLYIIIITRSIIHYNYNVRKYIDSTWILIIFAGTITMGQLGRLWDLMG